MHTQRQPERLLPLSEVIRRTSKSRSAIYAGMRANPPTFPLPVKDGVSSRWVESEVEAYVRTRIAERDAKAAA